MVSVVMQLFEKYAHFPVTLTYRPLLLKLLGIGRILGVAGVIVAWIGGQKNINVTIPTGTCSFS
jgi:hypothetical protein